MAKRATGGQDGAAEARRRIAQAARDGARELDLRRLGLTTLPPEIGQLTALQRLDLDINRLGALPPDIGQLTALRIFHIGNNRLRALPPEIGQLNALQHLHLDNNQLGALPPEIGHLHALQILYLRNNQLGALPPEIGQLTGLQGLYLRNNQLGALPREIGRLTALRILFLSNNQLGSLPPEIGQLAALQNLYLGNNQLGVLPPEIGQLTALQTLSLDDNQFVALPPEIGQLTALQNLYLGNNQLGALPPEIGQLTALRGLTLSSNQLAALVPEIAQLTALQRLTLDNNQLVALPPEIGQLTALLDAALADNEHNTKGLWIAGNPLPAELVTLAAQAQPAATRDVLAWLRAHVPATLPPTLPARQAGIGFVIDAEGAVDFAPPGALDAEGNNLRRLRSLHPDLLEAVEDLIAALAGGNQAHHLLLGRVRVYRARVAVPLDEVDFDRLYAAGVRLANAHTETLAEIADGTLPPLAASGREAMQSLLSLHGPFILASKSGQEALGEEARYRRNQDEELAFRIALLAFARALKEQPASVIRPEVGETMLAAAEDAGRGDNPVRSSVVAGGMASNVALTLVTAGLAGAMTALPIAEFGAAGGVLAAGPALVTIEALKASAPFKAVREVLTAYLNHAGQRPAPDALSALPRHQALVLRMEGTLRSLARQGAPFAWIDDALDWLKRQPPPPP